jgi:N,N-dimethylformamidase beta subunit-like protein
MRYEDAQRTMVEYRDGRLDPEPDRTLKTERFRDLDPPRPERDLIGQQYADGLGSPYDERAFRFVPSFSRDLWSQGLDIDPDRPLQRLVGYEWDTLDDDHAPPRCVRILHYAEAEVPADSIRWTAPSGARVFSAGSLQFAWGLDDFASPGTVDERIAHLMRAGVHEMLS